MFRFRLDLVRRVCRIFWQLSGCKVVTTLNLLGVCEVLSLKNRPKMAKPTFMSMIYMPMPTFIHVINLRKINKLCDTGFPVYVIILVAA